VNRRTGPTGLSLTCLPLLRFLPISEDVGLNTPVLIAEDNRVTYERGGLKLGAKLGVEYELTGFERTCRCLVVCRDASMLTCSPNEQPHRLRPTVAEPQGAGRPAIAATPQ
jgi:hypothetical protein